MRALLPDGPPTEVGGQLVQTYAPVVVDGQPVQIYFNYGDVVADFKGASGVQTRYTECVIRPVPTSDTDDPQPFSVGTAICGPADNFDRAAGRFLAWQRATSNPGFTKDEKRALWTWFTSTCRLPRDKRSLGS